MKYSKVQPLWQFILLSLATFDLYHLYWFYKTWLFLKQEQKLSIRPSLRALFGIFFTWSLSRHLNQLLKKEHLPYKIPAFLVAVSYLLLTLVSGSDHPLWLLTFFASVSLLPLVHGMNLYWKKQEKSPLPVKPFKPWQWVLIALGLGILVLAATATIVEFFGPGYWEV